MKRFCLAIFLLLFSVGTALSQRNLVVHKHDGTTVNFLLADVDSLTFDILSSFTMPMSIAFGGTFQMGNSKASEWYEMASPAHSVALNTFFIDRCEITYYNWTEVRDWAVTHGYTDLTAGVNSCPWTDGRFPVVMINWYDVIKWCNARSEKDGLAPVYFTDATKSAVYRTGELDLDSACVNWSATGYRLPTEAEWEFAARGAAWSLGYPYSGDFSISAVAWGMMDNIYNVYPRQVGTKEMNEIGTYDMSGNVYEWCWDWYAPYPVDGRGVTSPAGPVNGSSRCARGGCVSMGTVDGLYGCTVSYRQSAPPSDRADRRGFRCVKKY